MDIRINITPSIERAVDLLDHDMEAGQGAAMSYLLLKLEARAVKGAPKKTGDLINTITNYTTDGGAGGVVKATAGHAVYVHEGTGLYGPHNKRIVPTEKKAMFWPGAAHPFRSTRGMFPRPFFDWAARRTDRAQVYSEGLSIYLKRKGY